MLKYLVEKAIELRPNTFFLLDERCAAQFEWVPAAQKKILKAGFRSRMAFYKEMGQRFGGVFCFGNIGY